MSSESCSPATVHPARASSALSTSPTFTGTPTSPKFVRPTSSASGAGTHNPAPPYSSSASPRITKTPLNAITARDRKRSSPSSPAPRLIPGPSPETTGKRTPVSQSPALIPSTASSPSKRQKQDVPKPHLLPRAYANCPTQHLCTLISSLLQELVSLNDNIPLSNTGLTRFHSRAPPGISIPDYLNRLNVHASLQPSILLAMVYYIDILSTHYPPFVVSSLTVHRFLITAATVACKGLCDSFLTNGLYARIGGVSLLELNMLELEFLVRVGWRIVPKHEVLEEYYGSLVERGGERFKILDSPRANPRITEEQDQDEGEGAAAS